MSSFFNVKMRKFDFNLLRIFPIFVMTSILTAGKPANL